MNENDKNLFWFLAGFRHSSFKRECPVFSFLYRVGSGIVLNLKKDYFILYNQMFLGPMYIDFTL